MAGTHVNFLRRVAQGMLRVFVVATLPNLRNLPGKSVAAQMVSMMGKSREYKDIQQSILACHFIILPLFSLALKMSF